MRLSSAMALGSCLGKMEPGNWAKCILGRSLQAVGVKNPRSTSQAVIDRWPWLAANHDEYLIEIVALFDQRVFSGHMTVDELIEYVRSIEPDCDCGTRECCCERVTDVEVAELLALSHHVAEGVLQRSHHG